MMLSLLGHDTLAAHDGLQARAGRAFRPELILLDIGLPKLNGFDACRRIREQPWGTGILIVAVTVGSGRRYPTVPRGRIRSAHGQASRFCGAGEICPWLTATDELSAPRAPLRPWWHAGSRATSSAVALTRVTFDETARALLAGGRTVGRSVATSRASNPRNGTLERTAWWRGAGAACGGGRESGQCPGIEGLYPRIPGR